MKQHVFYEQVKVVHVPFDELNESEELSSPVSFHVPKLSVVDLLTLVSHLPLSDQLILLANTLTITGFKQREISEALMLDAEVYRSRLMRARERLRNNS